MVKIKVERLIHPTEWVQKSKIGDIKVANVSFEDEHSVRNVISKYNRFQGRRTGKFIHVTYNVEAERIGIYVVSREERVKELNGDRNAKKMEEQIPKEFLWKRQMGKRLRARLRQCSQPMGLLMLRIQFIQCPTLQKCCSVRSVLFVAE
mgnify:CR=1 FL=1